MTNTGDTITFDELPNELDFDTKGVVITVHIDGSYDVSVGAKYLLHFEVDSSRDESGKFRREWPRKIYRGIYSNNPNFAGLV